MTTVWLIIKELLKQIMTTMIMMMMIKNEEKEKEIMTTSEKLIPFIVWSISTVPSVNSSIWRNRFIRWNDTMPFKGMHSQSYEYTIATPHHST